MRRIICSALVLLAAGATAALGGGTAAAAPLPFLAVDCQQNVLALKGQPVLLARLSVVGLVAQAVNETPGLGALRATAVTLTFPLGGPLPVGEVPDGTGEIPAAALADVVANAVKPMGELAPHTDAAVARVRALVTEKCGMTLRALDATKPKPGTPAPKPGQTPGGGSATTPNAQPVGGYTTPDQLRLYDAATFAAAAPRDYGTVPFAKAGLFVPSPNARYGSVPGFAPEFGLLTDNQEIRGAGAAKALPAAPAATVGMPILIAVLVLSVVTGALVRTWVLREA
ncbi:hypothetical protein [Alloactinosynnema sp. L-07]|uniref:hypothetical protein n=1 Tax=Alloactinosynnema sp. L-07 TaxID=1653480 RepID=UPI00065EFF43|nr:hypothetical protein [Alloactinosynnema sp. L-07]CRK60657.1 hypothetical protein [Alloactinosynnema sp. L-07]